MPIEMEIIRLLFLNEVNSQMAHRPESMDWDMVTLVLENVSHEWPTISTFSNSLEINSDTI